MKRIYAIAAAIGFALATTAYAQGRHDEKPHGVPGKPSAAPETSASDRQPGRHDERPHGKPATKGKKAQAKKAEPKKDGANK